MEEPMKKKKFDGEKLRNMRLLSGRTLEEVAAANKFDTSSLSLWENGRRPGPRNMKKLSEFYKVPIAAFFAGLALLFVAPSSFAAVTDAQAVRAIVGEAANQGFDGMTAVGEVIRKRGSVRGLYGYKAMEKRKEPARVWEMAEKAWQRSASTSITHGATLFENIEAFGFPKSWDRSKVRFAAKVGDHSFFSEK